MTRQVLILVTLLGALSACSGGYQPDSNSTSAVATTVSTTGTVPTTPGGTRGSDTSTTQWYWTQGGQAQLTISSSYAMDTYLGRTPGTITNPEINLYLSSGTGGSYVGYTRVAYQETDTSGNVVYHDEEFDSGDASSSVYNAWVNVNGTTAFQSFFQDTYGGLIVVIDSRDDDNLLSGRVYFKNFNLSSCGEVGPGEPGYCAPQAPVGCWMISLGPYDCQDFLVNGKVTMGSTLYPTTYTLLGTFSGMNYSDVFN